MTLSKNVKFINEPKKMIEIEDKGKKVEIKANVEFQLTIPSMCYYELDKINKMIFNNIKFALLKSEFKFD